MPCRINTYGNSFTQCHQVNDGETWQEYLAAHLGEPIRNYGMSGFGVYQAYRRMIRNEDTETGAENVIFYIWGDDHSRSLLRSRHIVTYPWWDVDKGRLFHGNFWANIEMDLEKGVLVEKESLCPTPESLYNMTDPDFMYGNVKDDLMLQLYYYKHNPSMDIDFTPFIRLSEILGVEPKYGNETEVAEWFTVLRDKYGFAATKYILEKTRKFLEERNKKLLVVLLDPGGAMLQLLYGQPRYDQEIVDFLKSNGYTYFDMNEVHAQDYKKFNITVDEYYDRYFIGHYNPAGNHFFAYAIKDSVIKMLDPKPLTYREGNDAIIGFEGYLEARRQ
jgi:hypothetical protein